MREHRRSCAHCRGSAAEGIWPATLEPALGEHTGRRLVGCLNDWKVTGITGRYIGTRREYLGGDRCPSGAFDEVLHEFE